MRGFNVLHPMGWDAFGLPAEQYAIQTGTHPRITTQKNIDTFRRQIKMLGFSYDWDREVDTTDPKYFKWTQWIFLQLFDTWYDAEARKGPAHRRAADSRRTCRSRATTRCGSYRDGKRLAYQAEVPVNWCPALGTVLANEEVIDGKSERGNHPVVRMPLRQWLLRITDYAERLLDDLALVDWSDSIKKMQRNWIGQSEGARSILPLASTGDGTQAVDPRLHHPARHALRRHLHGAGPGASAGRRASPPPSSSSAVDAYQAAGRPQERSGADRAGQEEDRRLHRAPTPSIRSTSEAIPIWIADYVLASYGTGAIMAVPAHDERDFEFAKQFGLPIRTGGASARRLAEENRQHAGAI